MAVPTSSSVLYQLDEGLNCPSLSPACIQAQAYLHLAGVTFVGQSCKTSSQSPNGCIPALELATSVSEAGTTPFDAARNVISTCALKLKDLDAHLTASQRAEVHAFSVLIQSKLDVATMFSIWCETAGFWTYSKAAYGSLSFPLNYAVPLLEQRAAKRHLPPLQAHQVYEEAAAAIAALAAKLRGSGGPYLMGAMPCSLDALAMGHLLFYRYSPAAAPTLKDKVESLASLGQYVDHILARHFPPPSQSAAVRAAAAAATARSNQQPQQPPSSARHGGSEEAEQKGSQAGWGGPESSWTGAARGQPKPKPQAVKLTEAERTFRRHSMLWLSGAGAALATYILVSGKYLQVLIQHDEDGGEEDEEEDDDADDAPGDE